VAKLPVRAAVDRPIRSATGVHVPPGGQPDLPLPLSLEATAVSPGWAAEPGCLNMERSNANRQRQHRARDPSSASTPSWAGEVDAADLSVLARALVAAALAVHGRPAGCRALAGRSGVAGSARWRLHPPGQRNQHNEGGCDRG
jgi:hypothetical protein